MEGGIETAASHRLGRHGQLFARRRETRFHAPSRGVVAQALPRRVRRRPLGHGRRPPKRSPGSATPITRATTSGPCTPPTATSISSPTSTANEKTIKYGGPEVMKSVNNIWKISEQGRHARPGDPSHRWQPVSSPASRPTARPSSTKTTSASGSSTSPRGKITEIRIDIKSDSKENDTELVTVSNNQVEGFHLSPSNRARRDRGARRGLHHRHRPRRAAARHRNRLARAGSCAGRPTASGSRSSPTAPGGRKCGSPTSWARPRRSSATPIAIRAPSRGRPIRKSLLWNGSDHKLRKVDIDTGEDRRRGLERHLGNMPGRRFRRTANGSRTAKAG